MIQYNIDAEKELVELLDREILERIIHDFKPEIGVGDYTIKQIMGLFRRKQLMNRYGKFEISRSNGLFVTVTEEEYKAGKGGYMWHGFKIFKSK
jgi:hypothetical protein